MGFSLGTTLISIHDPIFQRVRIGVIVSFQYTKNIIGATGIKIINFIFIPIIFEIFEGNVTQRDLCLNR